MAALRTIVTTLEPLVPSPEEVSIHAFSLM